METVEQGEIGNHKENGGARTSGRRSGLRRDWEKLLNSTTMSSKKEVKRRAPKTMGQTKGVNCNDFKLDHKSQTMFKPKGKLLFSRSYRAQGRDKDQPGKRKLNQFSNNFCIWR